jgi:hypothetical protein
MRRSAVIEPVHTDMVVCLHATEVPARHVAVKASYARTKQDLRLGKITHRQVLFHLPDQPECQFNKFPTGPGIQFVKKVRSMPCAQGSYSLHVVSLVLVSSRFKVRMFSTYSYAIISGTAAHPRHVYLRAVARVCTHRVSCHERSQSWGINRAYFGTESLSK